jgi:thioredoxin-like negative regulator of GroEL
MVKNAGEQKTDVIRGGIGQYVRSLCQKLPMKRIRRVILIVAACALCVFGVLTALHYYNTRVERRAGRAAELTAKGDYSDARRSLDSALADADEPEQKAALYMQKATICESLKDADCVTSSYQSVLTNTKEDSIYATAALQLADYAQEHNKTTAAVEAIEGLRQKVAASPDRQIAIKGQDIIDLSRLDEQLRALKERS